ncbi:MAG: hypothetical protein AB8B73_09770 [Ekhidna sp.]
MDELNKKALMLLKSLIYHFHGLDDDEKEMLEASAKRLGAVSEMNWANSFISQDYMSAFERSREFLTKIFMKMNEKDRVKHLLEVWEENYVKGYVTEMETTAMFTLSKDWHVEKEFLALVQD